MARNMKKKFLEDIIPDGEKQLFDYFFEQIKEGEEEDNETIPSSSEASEGEADEKTVKALNEKLHKYLRKQFADLRDGMSEIAGEYDAMTIKAVLENMQLDDEQDWESLLILEAWGQK